MSKRTKGNKPLLWKWGESAKAAIKKPVQAMSSDQRFWTGFVFLCLITTLLINNPLWGRPTEQVYKEGDILRETIISPADIYFVDTEETEKSRNDARSLVKPIFRFESNKAD